MRTEHTHDVDLVEVELPRQAISQLLRQIGHFIERLDTLLVEPVCDLPRPIEWFTEFTNLLFEFVELEGPNVDLCVLGHDESYEVARSQQSCRRRQFLWRKVNLCLGFRSMKYLSILALLAVVILALASCAATTESFGTGSTPEGSSR